MSAVSPLRKQYLRIKSEYPHCLLFFRLGDFYETFDQDAEIVARELDIVLTGRSFRKGTRVPMAGVPHHSLENYLVTLLERGFHVAICDQVGDYQRGSGLVERKVTRVLTPGTIHEPTLLSDHASNYLLAIVPQEDQKERKWARAGLAYCDVSTGEFAATQVSGAGVGMQALEELARLRPGEVLLPARWQERDITFPPETHCSYIPDWVCESERAERDLLEHYETRTLGGLGLDDKPLATAAASAVLHYLRETQKEIATQLRHLRVYQTSEFMTLDTATRRNLELTESIRERGLKGSLWGVLKATETAMGARALHSWIQQPLLDIDRLNRRLDAVEALTRRDEQREMLRELLKGMADLERLAQRIRLRTIGAKALLSLKESLARLPDIQATLAEEEALRPVLRRLSLCEEARELIAAAIAEEAPANMNKYGTINAGYSEELAGILRRTAHARQWIERLEPHERERTGIHNLKVGYNRVFGYYLEVSKSHEDKVPADYIRKQTLVNAERYITPELKEYETQVLSAEEEILACERRIYAELLDQLAEHCDEIRRTAGALAALDATLSLAIVAVREAYSRPQLTEEDVLTIRAGRHPVVERNLPEEQQYIPNDTDFDASSRIHIITGPNMSGKSTYIRQVAIITLMAQIGSFVPADEAKIGIADRIFARIGAQDEIHAGQSTFMVEMVETARLLSGSSERSLLIIDEVGRGTSTYDGLAIARAVLEYIHDQSHLNCRTLFATHFHELTELPGTLQRARNFNVMVAEEGGRAIFTHRLTPGGANRSFGVHVAQLAGLPHAVITRARNLLHQLEEHSARPGERLPAAEANATTTAEELPPGHTQDIDDSQRAEAQLEDNDAPAIISGDAADQLSLFQDSAGE